ncbi:hypothetical protein GCM10010140_64960 [Streptosporangium pseudovulgare]|uniref:Uncharacterized protein n=1 Tax=Streptosporangium pseudovulgare TaxID=35765 RepID=A0ABQ2RFM5_9ACTN|nr:hypothetical protein GCM10010140_64960 [Streptosporangium pseudovulgare]
MDRIVSVPPLAASPAGAWERFPDRSAAGVPPPQAAVADSTASARRQGTAVVFTDMCHSAVVGGESESDT